MDNKFGAPSYVNPFALGSQGRNDYFKARGQFNNRGSFTPPPDGEYRRILEMLPYFREMNNGQK